MTHSELVSFISMTNFMYTNAELRVIMMMIGRLDFSMKTTYVSLSYPDMRMYSGMKTSSIQSAIKSMVEKGIISVISGQDEREKAYQLRKKAYRSIQKRMEGKETNAYDLAGLIYIANVLSQLRKKMSTDEVISICYDCLSMYSEKGVKYTEYISTFENDTKTEDTLSDEDIQKILYVLRHTDMLRKIRNVKAYIASFDREQIQSMLDEYEKLTHLDRYQHILSQYTVMRITTQHAEIHNIIKIANKLSIHYAMDSHFLYLLFHSSKHMGVMRMLGAYSHMFLRQPIDLDVLYMFHLTISDLENMLEN